MRRVPGYSEKIYSAFREFTQKRLKINIKKKISGLYMTSVAWGELNVELTRFHMDFENNFFEIIFMTLRFFWNFHGLAIFWKIFYFPRSNDFLNFFEFLIPKVKWFLNLFEFFLYFFEFFWIFNSQGQMSGVFLLLTTGKYCLIAFIWMVTN